MLIAWFFVEIGLINFIIKIVNVISRLEKIKKTRCQILILFVKNQNAVGKRVLKIIIYRTLFQRICTTNSELEKPPSPDVRIRIRVFFIFCSQEITLSIFIIKFIGSVSTKNHAINFLSVNFALFFQFTVLLPKCYPIVTEMIPNSV